MRVSRTVAFLDLCGFTAYTEREGDAAAVALLADLRAAIRREAEAHGVRVTKWLGDGVMLTGVEPFAVEACCREIIEHVRQTGPLALRGGLTQGPVIMFEGDDYIGVAVNRAARLCAAAAPGELLLDAPTVRPIDLRPRAAA